MPSGVAAMIDVSNASESACQRNAMFRGALPSLLNTAVAFGHAPSTDSMTTSGTLFNNAMCNGVLPSLFLTLAASGHRRTIDSNRVGGALIANATCSGVLPVLVSFFWIAAGLFESNGTTPTGFNSIGLHARQHVKGCRFYYIRAHRFVCVVYIVFTDQAANRADTTGSGALDERAI